MRTHDQENRFHESARIGESRLRLNETLRFMRSLWAVDHGLQSLSKRMRATVGLTGPQRLVVRILGAAPDLSAGELADILHLHQSTLTVILQRLERLGIVSRAFAVHDRRRAVLRLTPRGVVLDRGRAGTVEEAVRRALGRMTPRDRAATVRVLVALAGALRHAADEEPGRRARGRGGS
jgi:DNA-binding MarR family transcriptional regulator